MSNTIPKMTVKVLVDYSQIGTMGKGQLEVLLKLLEKIC